MLYRRSQWMFMVVALYFVVPDKSMKGAYDVQVSSHSYIQLQSQVAALDLAYAMNEAHDRRLADTTREALPLQGMPMPQEPFDPAYDGAGKKPCQVSDGSCK